MEFDIYNPHANYVVTKDYVQIIADSLQKAGHTTREVKSLQKAKENKARGVVCIQASTTRKAARCGYGTVVRWVQGAGENESYMRHHSRVRFVILSVLNWYAFRKTDFVIFVSEALKRHYERKFHTKFKHAYIMPCFNDEINKASFYTEGKYTDNVFTYAGTLSPWQCFEPTVALYREVEKRVGHCSFRVLTSEREKAEEVLQKYGVERYSLDFVPKEKVPEEMAKAKFGFCLRENHVVNRVATPTKFSNYIANGVLPVYSEYVEDFYAVAKDCGFCICANPGDLNKPVDELVALCNCPVLAEDVYEEYEKVFGAYYSKEQHTEKLSERLKEFLNDQERSHHSKKNNR